MAANWAMTTVVLVFVLMRLYTRVKFVSIYGLDDYLYILAFVSENLSHCP